MVSSCFSHFGINKSWSRLQEELEEIFTKVEDSRHAVSDRVLQHYKSLKSGNPATASDEPDESGRKSLEGDWYLFSIL